MRPKTRTVVIIILFLFLLVLLIGGIRENKDSDETSRVNTDQLSQQSVDKKFLMLTSTTTIPPTTTTTTTTTPPQPPTTTTAPPTPVSAAAQPPRDGVDWYAIAMCESSLGTGAPQWHINTGNGYYGGLQFSHSTWIAYGGGQYADNAHLTSPENQIAIASGMSLSHWPTCGRYG